MATPAAEWEARRVGVVVAAGEAIEVELDPEAPRNQALSASGLIPFPRIGGYVLIPTDLGATVGVISNLRVERASTAEDAEVVPLSRRILVAVPVAEIRSVAGRSSVQSGIEAFPSIGDPAVVPTLDELRLVMVGVGEQGDPGRIRLGTASASSSIVVDMSIDALFGRHVAVLGTTGSGKSNTVATLVRRTVSAAFEETAQATPRFIVLDPNGEYADAFADLEGYRHLVAEPLGSTHEQLTAPAWLWSIEEWCTLLRASPGVQAPVLRACISSLRLGAIDEHDPMSPTVLLDRLRMTLVVAADRVHGFGSAERKDLGQKLRALANDLRIALRDDELPDLGELGDLLEELDERRRESKGWYGQFEANELQALLGPLDALRAALDPDEAQTGSAGLDTDAPHAFDVSALADELRREAAARSERDHVEPLAMRVEALLQDETARRVLAPEGQVRGIRDWLDGLLGEDGEGSVTVLDLSLLPSNLTHIVAAVLARFVFEAHHRHLREIGHVAPSVLVLDEAHRFVQAPRMDEDGLSAAERCRAAFSRVAREGRKFGLGLVLASQRPSEIASGILAQCGTMIVHRLSHERDINIVRTAMGQASSSASQLPSLPTGGALLSGWAVRTPQLVRVDRLPEHHRPRSADPPYWREWTADPSRDAFSRVAREWLLRAEQPHQDQ